jgi:hypothetical protein
MHMPGCQHKVVLGAAAAAKQGPVRSWAASSSLPHRAGRLERSMLASQVAQTAVAAAVAGGS